MENNSGMGELSTIPAEIDRWNWGAFLATWIWGIGNNTLIAFLIFVPFVNIVMLFVLGAKGSAWAWKNKRWESIERFRQVQRKWAIWSLVAYVAMIGLFAILFLSISAAMKNSDAYKMAVEKLNSNSQAISILGTPIVAGMPMGSIEVSGSAGAAEMSFSVQGTKQQGTVYFDAKKELGRWEMQAAVLELESSGERIDLN
jgi:hypothetical protein